MNKFRNETDIKYIEELRKEGLDIIKGHKIELTDERLCKFEKGVYAKFDCGILLTTETRIYIEDLENENIVPSKTKITKCYTYDISTKSISDGIELIKLAGNGYAVYCNCIVKRYHQLRFNIDSDVPAKISILNFSFVGDKN